MTGHVEPVGDEALLREREMVIAVKPIFAPSPWLSMLYNRNCGLIYHLQKNRSFCTLGDLLLKHFQGINHKPYYIMAAFEKTASANHFC